MFAYFGKRAAGPRGLVAASIVLLAGACTAAAQSAAKTSPPTPKAYDASPVLASIATHVIVPVYADLARTTAALDQQVESLVEQPSAERVDKARAAWRRARVPWENGEAFLFGPAATEGYDPRLDSWPLDTRSLERVLASSAPLNQAAVDGLDDNLRGYHTVEYLLFGGPGEHERASARAVAEALRKSQRRRAYLKHTTADMHQTAQALFVAWRADGGNYAAQLAHAGSPDSSRYASQRAAMREIIQGMVGIAGETARAKLGDPLNQRAPRLLESSSSSNSRADYSNNIRSIEHVYWGARSASAAAKDNTIGVRDFVRALGGETLDARVRAQITQAIERIEAIEQPLYASITGSDTQRTKIRQAIAACSRLEHTLRNRVLPLVDQAYFSDA